MVTVSLQDRGRRTNTMSVACRLIQPGVKIAKLLEGIGAEYFVVSFAELWGLPVGKESLETVTGEV